MRGAVITKFNEPWEMRDLPDPKPGAGQVVIRIEASGLCGTDLHVHHGFFPLPLPLVGGHEPVGEIVELGPGVTDLKVGDRVGVSWTQRACGRCHACQGGRALYCAKGAGESWMKLGGGNAERMVAWASGCTLVPQGVRPEDAAPMFCAGFTVMSGYRNASPRTGDRVAVLGIGGLGHIALQIARAMGHEVVAVTGSENKRQEALSLGAHHVVVAGAHAGNALKEIGGADVILSTSNSAAHLGQAVSGLRPEGRLVFMGVVDGPLTFNPMDMMFGQTRLIGSTQNDRRDLVEVLDLVAAGKVKPMLEMYPITKVNDALDRLTASKVRYRAVLTH